MTATQMYNQGMILLNEAGNTSVRSDIFATFLNLSQRAKYNDFFYNVKKKEATNNNLVNSFQNSAYTSEVLSPFEKEIGKKGTQLLTNDDGYFSFPPDFEHVTAVAVCINPDTSECEADRKYNKVKIISSNEIYASDNNFTTAPVWQSKRFPKIAWYRPVGNYETVEAEGQASRVVGMTLSPNREDGKQIIYHVILRYMIKLVPIVIATPPLEKQYAKNPNFQFNGEDVDCVFPDYIHEEIVRYAVELYLNSNGDYTAAAREGQIIQTGVV